jgi:hypothetical protein
MQKLKFSVDSTFQIGSYHVNGVSPCQDYALAHISENNDAALLVISDGCSSGGETDVGARFLAHRYMVKAKQALAKGKDLGNVAVDVTQRDLDYLGLTIQDFLATLMTVSADQEGVIINLIGDGVVVLENHWQRYVFQYEWVDNTPSYLAYHSKVGKSSGMDSSFESLHSDQEFPFVCNSWHFQQGVQDHYHEQGHKFSEVVPRGMQAQLPLAAIRYMNWEKIAIFSDGISQIRAIAPGQERLPLTEAVDRCVDFRNTQGSFVKRRIRKQIVDWRKQGLEPFDDLSCATLLIEPFDEEEAVIWHSAR